MALLGTFYHSGRSYGVVCRVSTSFDPEIPVNFQCIDPVMLVVDQSGSESAERLVSGFMRWRNRRAITHRWERADLWASSGPVGSSVAVSVSLSGDRGPVRVPVR